MKMARPSFSVRVDVRNPGQFFACCGLLELAHRLWPGAEGWFDDAGFSIRGCKTNHDPCELKSLLGNLASAHAEALEPGEDPKIPPILLGEPFTLRMDWWLDSRGRKTSFGKMFSGQKRTLKDVRRLQQALQGGTELREAALFDWAVPLKGRFGVDPRAAWTALGVGFSPNDQGMKVRSYPAVELLGAVGLQGFRPTKKNRAFEYGTWTTPLPAPVARAVAGGLIPSIGAGVFGFQLVQRGSYKGFGWALPQGAKDE